MPRNFTENEQLGKWVGNVSLCLALLISFSVIVISYSYYRHLCRLKQCLQLRQHYKQRLEGKKNSLNDSRVKRLGDLGFEWSLRRRHTTTKLVSWEDRFNELKELYARHGQCNVSKSIDNKQLGHWISNVSLYTPVGPIFMPKSSVSPRDYFVNSNVSSTETVRRERNQCLVIQG